MTWPEAIFGCVTIVAVAWIFTTAIKAGPR